MSIPAQFSADTEKTIQEYREEFLKKCRNNALAQTARVVRRKMRELAGSRYPAAGKGVVPVPAILQPPSLRYAGYEGPWLEEEFLRGSGAAEFGGAKYLPILWDNFFAQAQAGAYLPGEFARRFRAMWELLAKLGKSSEAYFTLLGIYDFPIWNWHLFPKNIVVFAANGYGDVALPLLFKDRPFQNPAKRIRCSFLGRTETNPLRTRMREVFAGEASFGFGSGWEETMGASLFSLCPRGLGPTSFRIAEAMSLGSIPVYIWEKWKWLPYEEELDWSSFAIVAEAGEMEAVKRSIQKMGDGEIRKMQANIAKIYPERFRYEGVSRYIQKRAGEIRGREEAERLTAKRAEFRY